MTFRRFEDIRAWQAAREVVRLVYAASKGRKFGHDFGLRDQLRRAAVSIMANIAEGFAHRSDKEFARFLFGAKGSSAEVQSHLYVAHDQGYVNGDEFKVLYAKTESCSKQLAGLISFLLGRTGTARAMDTKTADPVDTGRRRLKGAGADSVDSVDSEDSADVL